MPLQQPLQLLVPASEQICSTKPSKIAISENLDPHQFSAIWYGTCTPNE